MFSKGSTGAISCVIPVSRNRIILLRLLVRFLVSFSADESRISRPMLPTSKIASVIESKSIPDITESSFKNDTRSWTLVKKLIVEHRTRSERNETSPRSLVRPRPCDHVSKIGQASPPNSYFGLSVFAYAC